VCHLIDAAASSANHTQHSCTVYANPSAKVRIQLDAKLSAAWVFGASEAETQNLVCGQTQQWQAIGVEWTKEGAKFNRGSTMLACFPRIGDMSAKLTWLIRFSEEPYSHMILCNLDNQANMGPFLFKSQDAAVYFDSFDLHNLHRSRVGINASDLTFDVKGFADLGIVAETVKKEFKFFRNGELVNPSNSISKVNYTKRVKPCFGLGYFIMTSEVAKFLGTVRAVGLSNDAMNASEISNFFKIVN
jgi:hypothetical protein